MSWMFPDHISRQLGLSSAQRRHVHRNAWRIWAKNRWNIVIYLAVLVFYLATISFATNAGGYVASTLGVSFAAHKFFRAIAPFALFLACFLGGGVLLQRMRFSPCVYAALREAGYDVCVKCGYQLKGLRDDCRQCPECGSALPAAMEEEGDSCSVPRSKQD